MFFTRFPINMTRRETRRLLASPYLMHAAIAGSFPSDATGDSPINDGRLLWRVDRLLGGGAYLYIVSLTRPSLVGLDEQIGFPDLPHGWQMRDYNPFLSRIEDGQSYAFRLVANPSVSRSTRGGRSSITDSHGRSKRIGHLTVVQQEAWLIGGDAYIGSGAEPPELFTGSTDTRASRNGFDVVKDECGYPRLVLSNSQTRSFMRGQKSNRITLTTAQYDGVLKVTDADALRHALVSGIGHGKGFGCGLLTLALPRAE